MTAKQIQQIKEKYKNPTNMQHAINNVAGILANEYVKQGLNIELNEKIKSVDLINQTNANKFVFSTGETLIEAKDILSLHFETKKEENA